MKKFKVAEPVMETWVFEVEAETEHEAMVKVERGQCGPQLYTMSGWPHGDSVTVIGEINEKVCD